MDLERPHPGRCILVIEDDPDIAHLVGLHLRDLGCEVELAADGSEGLEKALASEWDLVILDLMLPGVDGLEICRRLRSQPSYVPVLMLTAKSSDLDRVLGLELGADDYLTKPFNILELVARVKALFRRIEAMRERQEPDAQRLSVAGLEMDVARRQVKVRGAPVQLTAREFDLLLHFARHPGRVYSRAQLLDLVWGYGHTGYEHTVNSHINRLRGKIEEDPSQPRYILTVWGVGYKFLDGRRTEE
jgi:DNA-binding response OmpR family regulator